MNNHEGKKTNQVAIGLGKIALALRHHAWEQTAPHSLNPTQGQVLAVLRSSGGEALALTELAGRMAVSQPTVSDSVQALVKKGLVEKHRGTDDRRVVHLHLTEKGEAEADRLAEWPDFFSEAIGVLSEDEQRIFTRALIKMIRSLQDSGRIPVARMCVSCRFFQPNVYDDPSKPHHCLFVNAPFGDVELRTDCDDYESANKETYRLMWEAFNSRKPVSNSSGSKPQIDQEEN